MRNRKIVTGMALGLGLSAVLLAGASSAAGVSGKKNLICTTAHVVGCAEGVCLQGDPHSFGLMNFFFIDATSKVVSGVDENGEEVISPVTNAEVTEKAYILQGFENHRGWTMGIDRDDGDLNMSSTGADLNFILTGNCTER